MTGILKNNNMESDTKAHKGSNDVGKHAGYGVTRVTPKVTPDRKFHPHFDAKNSTSWDDDDSATNSSTSNSSFLEMKVWVKKAEKTFLVPEYNTYWKIPNAQADANFSAGSSNTTAETSNYGGGVTSTTCPSVVQSNACIGAFCPRLPYNHNNGEDSDGDGEQSKQSYLESNSNDYSYEELYPETEGKHDTKKVKPTVSPFCVKHPTKSYQELVEVVSSNTMSNDATSSGNIEDDQDDTPSHLMYYKGWTFPQVREFKYKSQGNMKGIVTPSGMFYSCLACTIQDQTGTTQGENHHPVCKDNPQYKILEEEYTHILDYNIKALSLQHQSSAKFESRGKQTTWATASNNDDDGKQPATNAKKLDKLNSGLAKQKSDWAINESDTLSAENNGNLDVMQPTRMNKQQAYSFDSASGVSEMSSMSGLNIPIKPFPPFAAINKAASKPAVKAGGCNKLKAIPLVAAVNQAVPVKPVVKGGEQKAIAASSSGKKSNDPGIVLLEKNIKKKVSESTEKLANHSDPVACANPSQTCWSKANNTTTT